jgi:hypothetical protein
MSLGHGATVVKDSLVFAYDMGSKQSWKGKPTTNTWYNDSYNYTNGATFSVVTNYPSTKGLPVEAQGLKVIKLTANTPGTLGQCIPWRSGVDQVNGGVYCHSVWAYLESGTQVTVGQHWNPWDYGSSQYIEKGKWVRIFDPVTNSANNYGNIANAYRTDGVAYFTAPQYELGADMSPFVLGTRSNTESVIDWAGKNNIAPVDLIYTSDNKFIFNGLGETDGSPLGSYIPIPTSVSTTNPSTKPNGVTYDFWIKADTDAPDRMGLIVGSGTINHIEIYSTGKYFRTEAVTQNGYSFGSGGFPNSCRGVWSHFAIVFANNETNRPVRWYQNGELFYTHSNMGSGTDVNQYFQPSRLGSATGSGSYLYAPSFKGEFPVFKSYDKALTTQEVKQNFEALRGRFGI